MSTFVCAECNVRFEGDLREAADGAFRHSAEHADRADRTNGRSMVDVTKTPVPTRSQVFDFGAARNGDSRVMKRILL